MNGKLFSVTECCGSEQCALNPSDLGGVGMNPISFSCLTLGFKGLDQTSEGSDTPRGTAGDPRWDFAHSKLKRLKTKSMFRLRQLTACLWGASPGFPSSPCGGAPSLGPRFSGQPCVVCTAGSAEGTEGRGRGRPGRNTRRGTATCWPDAPDPEIPGWELISQLLGK